MAEAKYLMDCSGNHLIEVDGVSGLPARYESPSVCVLKVGGKEKIFVAFTGYWDGIIPTGTAFELIPIATAGGDSPECNLFCPEEVCTHGKEV